MAQAGAGMSPGIAHLCDSRVVVYRTTPDRDEFGDTVDNWAEIPGPDGLNARPNQDWLGNLNDPGPGERQATMERWFLVTGFDIRERDVVSVLSGPKEGLLYRVHSVDKQTNPHIVHHLQVNLEVWDGSVGAPVETPESGGDGGVVIGPAPSPGDPLPGPGPGTEPEPGPEPEPEPEPGPPESPPAALLFFDDFTDGNLSPDQNGVGWRGTNVGAAEMVGIVADGTNPSGYALGFTFGGNPNLADDAWAEKRMRFPNLPKCYVEMRLLIPANYKHRDATGADNNKLLRLWDETYQNSMIHVGMSTLPRTDLRSAIIAEFRKASGTGNYGTGPWTTVFTPGQVYDIGFEVTPASAVGVADGHIRIWVNDALVYDRDDLELRNTTASVGAANVIRNGYLLGWANSGFTETTVIKLQRVIVATERVVI